MWQTKKFNELTPKEIYEIYRVRSEVFLVEQDVKCVDPDVHDLDALHVFEINQQGKIDAYARIFVDGDKVTFGRVLTSKSVRGTGKGAELLQQILQQIKINFAKMPIEIDAQVYASGYYNKFDFHSVGSVFLEEGIEHIKMIHNPL